MDKQRDIEQMASIIATAGKESLIVRNDKAFINTEVIAKHLADVGIGDKSNALFRFTDILEKRWQKDIEELKGTRSRIKDNPELVSHYTQLIVSLETCIEDMNCELSLFLK